MADPTDNNPDLRRALAAGGIESDNAAPTDGEYQPVYKMVGDQKIPVSKSLGSFWKSRRDYAMKARQPDEAGWKEAFRYYNNDQMKHRNSRPYGSGNTINQSKLNETWSETENVVFANTTTMLPLLYSKNPEVEVTASNDANSKLATCIKHLVNTLMTKRDTPGLNLKAPVRRSILHTLLTNNGWVKLGYTFKQDSSQQALQNLQKLSDELASAKSITETRRIEGELQALEETIDLLTPEGCTRKTISPFNMLVDPDGTDPDNSDANWMMECDMLPTSYIKAKYGQKGENGKDTMIFEPTHVLKIGGKNGNGEAADEDSAQADVNNFSLMLGEGKDDAAMYGFSDNDAYRRSWMTKVWYVWDKTTRRMYMFNDGDWTWPLWVWNDPYKLLEFFPYYRLHFHESVEGTNSKGEVTYYLDQQDAINDINTEMHNARNWVRRNVFFDNSSGLKNTDVEAVLKGTDGTARGIPVPEGHKISELFFTVPPPSLAFPQLFDTAPKYQAIDRISSVSSVMRGEQFKTNTTNDAVQSYQQGAAIRNDEKTDAIEDWMGRIALGAAQLCYQNMTTEDVTALIGEDGNDWQQGPSEDFRTKLNMTIVGGSTQKPTSAAKKQEAMQMGQVLGQFAKTSPFVIKMLLDIFERAFDDVVVTDDDWEQLKAQLMQQMQQQGAPGGQPGAGGAPGEQGPNPIEAIVQMLPDNAKAALQDMIQKGVPQLQALLAILHQVMQGQPGGQSAAPAQGEQQ